MSERMSRRKVLGGVAVGGAVVWAAPAVVSVSAASAATAPPDDDLVVDGSFEASGIGPFASPWIAGV